MIPVKILRSVQRMIFSLNGFFVLAKLECLARVTLPVARSGFETGEIAGQINFGPGS